MTTTTRIRDPRTEGRSLDAFLLDPAWASAAAALPSPAGAGRSGYAGPGNVENAGDGRGFLAVAAAGSADGRLKAVSAEAFDAASGWDILATEADGARGLSLKAPGLAEPVVPDSVDIVFALIGLDSLGRPLDERVAFRPELVSERTGLPAGAIVTPEAIACLAVHPEGCLKGAPAGAALVVVLNKLDRSSEATARALAGDILARGNGIVTGVALARLGAERPGERIVDFLAP